MGIAAVSSSRLTMPRSEETPNEKTRRRRLERRLTKLKRSALTVELKFGPGDSSDRLSETVRKLDGIISLSHEVRVAPYAYLIDRPALFRAAAAGALDEPRMVDLAVQYGMRDVELFLRRLGEHPQQ